MSDENTSDPPASSAPAANAAPADAPEHKERRNELRAHVRWHVDAFIDGHDVYHGYVKEISPEGADIFIDHNLQQVKSIRLHIFVPPLRVTDDHHGIEVSGKIIYVAHDPDELLFRTGIKFLKFTSESDLAYLRSRVAMH